MEYFTAIGRNSAASKAPSEDGARPAGRPWGHQRARTLRFARRRVVMQTMKAAVVRAFGKPLVLEEVPMLEPKAGESPKAGSQLAFTGTSLTDINESLLP